MKVRLVGLLSLALVLSCAKTTPTAPTPDAARVRVSEGNEVDGCTYLGDFVGGGLEGKPGLTGWWETDQVRGLASEKGATDVVLDKEAKGHLVGKGYRCP